ncbi:MAG: hypothetical protein Unbinned8261contig1001_40 [Prokaryotic dsDNA virus sp.]|nr:MAG: hypothetical protein Unbinned8261contig1001_40 [Prokaryotic dsDNA virus sp.]
MDLSSKRKEYAHRAALFINNEDHIKGVFKRCHSLTECGDLFNNYVVKRMQRKGCEIYGFMDVSLEIFFEHVETRIPGIHSDVRKSKR